MSDVTVAELGLRLSGEIEAVVADLGLKGGRSGRSLVVACPWSHPKASAEPKLYVRLQAPRGSFIDFRSGAKGDALWLVAMVLSGGVRDRAALAEAVKWARDRYGMAGASFDREKWNGQIRKDAERMAREEIVAAEALKKKRGQAQAKWLAARPLAKGQAGYDYLVARGIDFQRLGRIPRAIHYAQAEGYYSDGREIYSGPCLMTAMTLPDGQFGALHRIWIDPDRPGEKIDLGADSRRRALKPRKMWPDSGGCAMRIWRGSSGLSEREAVKHGVLDRVVVCEGVEDALSLAVIAPECRVMAAGSLSGLLLMTPPPCTDTLTIAADRDWGNPQAEAQLYAAVRRFVDEFSLTVKVSYSPVGKDFNDLLRQQVGA